MVGVDKSVAAVNEDSSSLTSSDSTADEKTIPFLRRLRDMLRENEGTISFVPGYQRNGQRVLGRLVVHDRIQVEATVLPRYFNHSSFASLRRQLNYFSFVRLGKGRQRESTYINDGVVELDDILALRRRSSSAVGGGRGANTMTIGQEQQELTKKTTTRQEIVAKKEKKKNLGQPSSVLVPTTTTKTYVESIVPVVHLPNSVVRPPKFTAAKRAYIRNNNKHQATKKRTKKTTRTILSLPPSVSSNSSSNNSAPFVSEDEESHQGVVKQQQQPFVVALDLTQPTTTTTTMTADPELLEGCTALLELSGRKLWG